MLKTKTDYEYVVSLGKELAVKVWSNSDQDRIVLYQGTNLVQIPLQYVSAVEHAISTVADARVCAHGQLPEEGPLDV